MKIVISDPAADDLAVIRRRTAARFGESVAEAFERRVARAFVLLGRHPEAGPHPHWSTRHPLLRFWVISRTPFLIFYEITRPTVSVERVLYGRRDVRRIIEDGVEDPPPPED